jgi:hypothetical protein
MRTKVWSALALSLIGSILGVHEARAQACVAWVAGGTYGIDPNLNNYETIAVGLSVWQSISAKYPSIGGAFDWQINEDLLNGGPFAEQLAPLVNPGGAPANVP